MLLESDADLSRIILSTLDREALLELDTVLSLSDTQPTEG